MILKGQPLLYRVACNVLLDVLAPIIVLIFVMVSKTVKGLRIRTVPCILSIKAKHIGNTVLDKLASITGLLGPLLDIVPETSAHEGRLSPLIDRFSVNIGLVGSILSRVGFQFASMLALPSRPDDSNTHRHFLIMGGIIGSWVIGLRLGDHGHVIDVSQGGSHRIAVGAQHVNPILLN